MKKTGTFAYAWTTEGRMTHQRKTACHCLRIDDTLDTPAGTKQFSGLNHKRGYWMVALLLDDTDTTAMEIHGRASRPLQRFGDT
jgi:hypothetical protein